WRHTRSQKIAKHIIGDRFALGETLDLVELPMNAEIDAALSVLFRCLAHAGELPSDDWPRLSVLIDGQPVEFIGRERKADIVGAVVVGDSPKSRRAETGMAGRVCWEWRSEVEAVVVIGRGAQWRPSDIGRR